MPGTRGWNFEAGTSKGSAKIFGTSKEWDWNFEVWIWNFERTKFQKIWNFEYSKFQKIRNFEYSKFQKSGTSNIRFGTSNVWISKKYRTSNVLKTWFRIFKCWELRTYFVLYNISGRNMVSWDGMGFHQKLEGEETLEESSSPVIQKPWSCYFVEPPKSWDP